MAAKPPTPSGVTAASAPPATQASSSPRAMVRKASPIACAPDAQALVMVKLAPRRPCRIEIWPGARFEIEAGMK